MTTIIRTYPDEHAARCALEALRAGRPPGTHIRLLTRTAEYDLRREPVGGFAGPIHPEAPVGTYDGGVLQRRQGNGSFAGDPDQQRQGSFGDVDRVVLITYAGARERARTIGDRALRRLLRRAALGDGAVRRAIDELGVGHAVVLVEDVDIDVERAPRAA
jgi:hypothetical protein